MNMTLDPDTAQPQLILSEDQRSVMQGAKQSQRDLTRVLGCEGFDSGQPCWEVEVGYGLCWAVRVALESVKRKGRMDVTLVAGIWVVGWYKEKFQALTSPRPTPVLPSMVPQRVWVCLDHAGGWVMFVNMDSEAVILTLLRATFAEKQIHPWLRVGEGSQLKWCPETWGGLSLQGGSAVATLPSCIPIWLVLWDSHPLTSLLPPPSPNLP
ncbi:LOW QUALITY PROTEIN: butyrophilin subfamily 2 member A2-like [Leptosomus discolor]